MPDLVQHDAIASQNLFNGLVGLGSTLKKLDLRSAARLLQAVLSVVADIASKNWLALPRDLKMLLDVVTEQVPPEHQGAVVAFAELETDLYPEDHGDIA